MSYQSGVLAYRINEVAWEVFCNRCGKTLGTMTGSGVQDAVLSTLGRGGVLCPDCRSMTCDICGEPASVTEIENPAGKEDRVKLCDGCLQSVRRVCLFI